jgi:malate dehydrogenase (oxaloacetate-decarboxylating)(NADP+)
MKRRGQPQARAVRGRRGAQRAARRDRLQGGGYGTPVLVGREDVYDLLKELGVDDPRAMKCSTAAIRRWSAARSTSSTPSTSATGMLRREIERMVNQDRNYLRRGDARAGRRRRDDHRHDAPVQPVAEAGPHGDRRRARARPRSGSTSSSAHQTVLIADTAVTERPTAEQYAAIAMRSAAFARRMGQEPRVAFISYTTFGNPPGAISRSCAAR